MKIKESLKKLPIVIMDIDGVLSPLHSTKEDYEIIPHDYGTWAIPYSIAGWLPYLEESSELIWGSMWEEVSNNIAQEILFKDLPYIDFKETDSSSQWLKIKAILEFLNKHKDRKVILVDDELTDDAILRLEPFGVKLFIPDGRIGLTSLEIKEITQQIKDWT